MRSPLLQVKNLSCGYGKDPVLRDIGLEIREREIVTLIGPNGSGKTTLLRAMTRILRPLGGSVLYRGRDIWGFPARELAREIAVCSQTVEETAGTVAQYVLLGRLPYFTRWQLVERRSDRRIVAKYLDMTGISGLMDRPMRDLSGGEKQLAAIARALCQEPALLVLDEPTSHLDIGHQARILDLVAALTREMRITVLMVLHDLNLASAYSDRVVLLHGGRISRAGTPEEVLTYQAIEEVYGTVVIVERSPLTGKPHVFLVAGEPLRSGRPEPGGPAARP